MPQHKTAAASLKYCKIHLVTNPFVDTAFDKMQIGQRYSFFSNKQVKRCSFGMQRQIIILIDAPTRDLNGDASTLLY
jgi:hypothetical protein